MRRHYVPLALLATLLVGVLIAPAGSIAAEIDTLFFETDLREAIHEIALMAGVNILVAETISGTVTLDIRTDSVERALEYLLAATPYSVVAQEDYFIVTSVTPGQPSFHVTAESHLVNLTYSNPEEIAEKLSSYPAEFAYENGGSVLFVTAHPRVLDYLLVLIDDLDRMNRPKQIAYQVHLIELTDQQLRSIGFREMVMENSAWQNLALGIVFDSSIVSLVNTIYPIQALAHAAYRTSERSVRFSSPSVMTTVGNTARIALETDTTVQAPAGTQLRTETSGVSLRLTPKSLSPSTGEVTSEVALTGSPETAEMTTTITTLPGEAKLIGVVYHNDSMRQRMHWQMEDRDVERYFALYLTAYEVDPNASGMVMFQVGALDGIAGFLWPSKPEFVKLSYVDVEIPIDGLTPGFNLEYWIDDKVRLNAGSMAAPFGNFRAGITWPALADELVVSLQYRHRESYGSSIGIGYSDRVMISPSLVLGGGVFPFVYSLDGTGAAQPYWWAEVELKIDRSSLNLQISSDEDGPITSLTLRHRLVDAPTFFFGVRWFPTGLTTGFMGLRILF